MKRMKRVGKTEEVKVIQSHFGSCWDDEAVYSKEEYSQIKSDLKEYHMSGGIYRVITRRVSRDDKVSSRN